MGFEQINPTSSDNMKETLEPAGTDRKKHATGSTRRGFLMKALAIGGPVFLAGCNILPTGKDVEGWAEGLGEGLGKGGAKLIVEFVKGVGGEILERMKRSPEEAKKLANVLKVLETKGVGPSAQASFEFALKNPGHAGNDMDEEHLMRPPRAGEPWRPQLLAQFPYNADSGAPGGPHEYQRILKVKITAPPGQWTHPIETPPTAQNFGVNTDQFPTVPLEYRVVFTNCSPHAARKVEAVLDVTLRGVTQGDMFERELTDPADGRRKKLKDSSIAAGVRAWIGARKNSPQILDREKLQANSREVLIWPAMVQFKSTLDLASMNNGPIIRYNEKPEAIGDLFDGELEKAGLNVEQIDLLRQRDVGQIKMTHIAAAQKVFYNAYLKATTKTP